MYINCFKGEIAPTDSAAWADSLSLYWGMQLKKFYDRGASALFASHWGNDEGWDSVYANKIKYNRTIEKTRYSRLINLLSGYRTKTVKTNISNSSLYHLSFEQALYKRSYGDYWPTDWYAYNYGTRLDAVPDGNIDRIIYPVYEFVKKLSNYTSDCGAYPDSADFITNFMISNSPSYLINSTYSTIYLTGTSHYMPDDVYKIFMSKEFQGRTLINSTKYSSNPSKYFFIPGIRNEYNKYRSPVNLVWRTNSTLQSNFPDANQGNGDDEIQDFISWCKNTGRYNYGDTSSTYRNWTLKNSSNKYNYDSTLYYSWTAHSFLQNLFSDGHYRTTDTITTYKNIIEWAMANDSIITHLPRYPEVTNYSYWPYIGGYVLGSAQLDPNISIPISSTANSITYDYKLEQNYPNPFNPVTTIQYSIKETGIVTLKIYNILGQEITELVNEVKNPGIYNVNFNASKFASGIYLYRLITNSKVLDKKMIVLK